MIQTSVYLCRKERRNKPIEMEASIRCSEANANERWETSPIFTVGQKVFVGTGSMKANCSSKNLGRK